VNDQQDSQLLRAYVKEHNEAAFAELVRRHMNLVYSAALRMVCGPQLAEDVTQGAFIALAKNAAQLIGRPVLSGWLHRTAQSIAAQTVWTDVRRRTREQEAAAMQDMQSADSDGVWEHIGPYIDAALSELSEADRDALLLRYFEGKSARQMAQVLGTSEEAAQKRANRAVERLRETFARRGIAVGASGLVLAISANAVHAAPASLALTLSAGAGLAGAAAYTSVATTTAKAITLTTLQKTLIAATLTVAVGTGFYEAHEASEAKAQLRALAAQQAPLAEQIDQFALQRDQVRSQLASAQAENETLKRGTTDLLKLRAEVAQLRRQATENAALQQANQSSRTPSGSQDPLSLAQLVRALGWGAKSARELSARYSEDWLKEISEPSMILKVGMALYDTGNYSNALVAFKRLEKVQPGTALVWQGHILDLASKRNEAVAAHEKLCNTAILERDTTSTESS
jgi:RNA polymerase sigma factor (sigma-70 family)